MFSKYFEKLEKNLIKKAQASQKNTTNTKTANKSKKTSTIKVNELMQSINKIVPSHLTIDSSKFIDISGYSPIGVDYIVYKPYFRDIANLIGGYIPSELVYGTYHISTNLNSTSLQDILKKVTNAKKINRYTEEETNAPLIPAFVIAYKTSFSIQELKNEILNQNTTLGIDHTSEIDIIAIFNKGIIIKDWKEKRSYIALETKKDTMMWFFILMNEYLDVNKDVELDLRKYVKSKENYAEY